jgi:hypothetical protein
MKTTNIYRILTLGLMLTLAACIDVAGPERGRGESVPAGMGLARIHLGGGGARTVVGGIGGLYFTLDFTAPGKTDVNEVLSGSMSLTVALEPAVWTLEVVGYTDSTKTTPKVRGSASIAVTAGAESNFEVYLAGDFSTGGTGSLSYSFGLPSTVSRAWFGLYPLDVPEGSNGTIAAGTWEQDISSFVGGTASDTLGGLPEGAYLAVVDLYDGGNHEAAVWTRAVHIDDGSTISLTRSFTSTDFAECDPVVGIGESTLADKLDAALGSPSGAYTIVLDGTESDLASFIPKSLNVTGDKNITVTIRGNGHEVQLGDNGRLFDVSAPYDGSSLNLVLQDVTLRGLGSNNTSLVEVWSGGGTLEMKAGSLITGNTSPYGGVAVSGGTFTMSGGAVSGNSADTWGSGVSVFGGTFTMSGGAVSGNNATDQSSGGISVSDGIFNLKGGAVSGNSASWGGGVGTSGGGIFTMSGGAVSGNSASWGGGVYVSYGTFTMSGGAVSGNSASTRGGGVDVSYGIFTMSGGAVRDNSSSSVGGGVVSVSKGTFSLSGGTGISYTASSGVGLYVLGTFTMSGGTVSGNILSGTASYGKEVAVYGTFKFSGDARPERVFLYDTSRFITIIGPLNGGTVPIDLGVTSMEPLTDWAGKQILQLDGSYSSGNLASLKDYFTLGNSNLLYPPYTEVAITGYTIDDGGYFAAE